MSVRVVRRDAARAAEARQRGLWVDTTLADALQAAARTSPQRTALVDNDVRIDCQTLYAQSTALAHQLLSRIPAGSVVSFMLPNWHEAAVVYHGATLAGMVVNPILPSLRDRELQFILTDSQSAMVFVPAEFGGYDYASMTTRVAAHMASPPHLVVVRGGDAPAHISYSSLLEAPHTSRGLPRLDADAARMILYTSGTSGRPKGVLHTHNSLHALIFQIRDHWRIDTNDRFLVPSPIAHIGGSIYAFECPVLLGTTAVLMDRWNAERATQLMVNERCTHIAGATPFLAQLLAAAERAGTHLPDLKVFICGGASVPPSLIRRAAGYFDRAVVTRVYGSTEVPVTTVGATDPGDTEHAADTDGRPGIAEIKLTRHGATPSDEGEICARGPQMLLGYLHPDDDQECFDDEGFFRTGDLGRWVDGEYLVVTGRAKDIIIRHGENIAPKEVEDILVGHPGIAEIAIVGVPDDRTGERACAVIVPTATPAPDVEELRGFLEDRGVSRFKSPEQVVVWESLPKNAAGKVLKHQIKAELTQGAEDDRDFRGKQKDR